MGAVGTTTKAKSTPAWMKFSFAAITAVALVAIGLNFMKPGRGMGGAEMTFGINPGTSRLKDDAQIRAKLDGFIQELQKGTKRAVDIKLTDNFQPLPDGKPQFDMIMAVADKMGDAVRDHGYVPVAAFRDLRVHFYVKSTGKGETVNKIGDIKNLKVGVFVRNSTVGPIAINWLLLNDVPLDSSHIVEFRNQDDLPDALMENRVDVISLSSAESNKAKEKFGARIKKISETDPFPGYAIAVSAAMDEDHAAKLTQTLWNLHKTVEGQAALKGFDIGSAAGTTELRQTGKREYEKAIGQIERARKLYPPPEARK